MKGIVGSPRRPGWIDGALRRPGAALAVICFAQLILSVDLTIVTVANASIERALGFTSANLQWTVTAYALTFGGFLLLGGRLSDFFGQRRLFIAGILGFAIASLGCGVSTSVAELIASRAAQGLCAAVISPSALALVAGAFPEGKRRQHAYGVWASFGSLGGLTGFFVGGVVTSLLGWRWVFFINVPIAMLAVAGALVCLQRAESHPARRRHLDLPGAITVTLAVALVIFGLGEAQSAGWRSPRSLLPLALAPGLLVLFIVLERLSLEPLVPVSLLRRRAAVANILAVFQQSIGAATTFLSPLFLQEVWKFTPLQAGAGTLPLPFGFVIGAKLSSRFVGRLGARPLVVTGFAFVTIGLLWLARLPDHVSYLPTFVPALLVRSFGQGLLIVPMVVTVTSGVPRENHGIVAGFFNMSQQLGGALGLAAIVTIVSTGSVSIVNRPLGLDHGFHLGFLVAASLALVGGLIATIWLRSTREDPRRRGSASPLMEVLDVEATSVSTP